MLKWKTTLKQTTILALFFSALTFSTIITHASENKVYQTGIASYYASKFDGRKTASGEIFSSNKLTCASRIFPFGTNLLITNLKTGDTVIVECNDFGPHKKTGRILDLSRRAAKKLNMIKQGLAKVSVVVISGNS